MATPFRHPLLKDPPGWLTPALFLSADRNRYRCSATAHSIIIVIRAGYTTSRKRGIQLPLDAHPAQVFKHTIIAFGRKLTANVVNGTAYPFPGQLKGSFDRRHPGVGHAAQKPPIECRQRRSITPTHIDLGGSLSRISAC
ncbi:hypothetical protein [Sphingomonas sp. CFBP 8760]|uniref:hypothetical protein n=1 Tax=Sphingomonas sp. CFBP 8760 TaxID=2775282 RepID=UPI001783ADB0|nr:hypothetical protein [Sphingomonas sp. CFBP 8760]MBD8546941.1 hypothetical protein [Sphingomonas sp. CFBP 8760]